jgi:uncharacterized membrane protein
MDTPLHLITLTKCSGLFSDSNTAGQCLRQRYHIVYESALIVRHKMEKDRLLAFSDGVLAIIITIMVLELKVPHGDAWVDLSKVLPVFLSYVLSFIYVAIYWNNHHHLMHTVRTVNGGILWANMHLLFWLSLLPFATGWLGENHFTPLRTALFGAALLMPAIAYTILARVIVANEGPGSILEQALGGNIKGRLSLVCYCTGIGFAFVKPWVSNALYVFVALLWLVPDRRIENAIRAEARR